jgi:hypothetical protein
MTKHLELIEMLNVIRIAIVFAIIGFQYTLRLGRLPRLVVNLESLCKQTSAKNGNLRKPLLE